MIPAAIAAATQIGGRIMASSVGKFLFGSTLRTLATGLTAGHMLGSRGGNARSQVQQFRA